MEPTFFPKINHKLLNLSKIFGIKIAVKKKNNEIIPNVNMNESLKKIKYKFMIKKIKEKIKPNFLLDKVFEIMSFLSSIS